MAHLILGAAMSHSPMLTVDPSYWGAYSALDRQSSLLVDQQGHSLTFSELEAKTGDQYAPQNAPEHWNEQWTRIRRSVERLAADIATANLDVLIIVGDDQMELFSDANIPALSIYYGDQLFTGVLPENPANPQNKLLQEVAKTYAMDAHHELPANGVFARALLEQLLNQGFDVGAHKELPTTGPFQGIGHAYTVMFTQLMPQHPIPMVPVLVNTYYPPNQPTPSRSYDLGLALRRAVEAIPGDLRVGVIASGGLSHFVVDEDLDQRVLSALREGDEQALRNLPRHLLNSGNSEIRNWITTAAASKHLTYRWDDYLPVYRTPAGTGCGVAFALWS